MSDKIDLAEISGLARRTLRTLGRVAQQRSLSSSETTALAEAEEMLALVRVARAAMALMQPTPEQLRDPMFLHRAGEGLRSELEAFTDSAKENSSA